ncbi:MAG: hypothetical protein RI959_1010 [Pseudomonadota bacterium]
MWGLMTPDMSTTARPDTLQRRAFSAGLLALGATQPLAAWAQTAPPSPAEMEARAGPLPKPGTQLILPRLSWLGGGVFEGGATLARPTVVYWWASTCPFCAQQSPEMDKLWRAHAQQLGFVGLSVDRTPQAAQAYLARKGYTFPSAWVSAEVFRQLPKPKGLPITLVLGRDSRVLQAEKGQLFPEDVAQLVRHAG